MMRWVPQSLIRYGLVGIGTNALLYGVFIILIRLGWSAVLAAAVCYVLGVALGYFLNRRWSFESSARHAHDFPRYLFVYGVGFVTSIVSIAVLTRWLQPEVAQLINVGVCAMVIYLCLRIVRFGHQGEINAD